jgi:hypothetical protein
MFQLALNGFERFMQVDDREFHPMTFVQKKHFEDAVSQALQRHMLFQSRIEIGRHDLPSWIPDPTLPPTISFGEFDDPIECPESEQFDNGKEAGVRIYVRQGDNKVRVTFYFDHKCTDGVGAHVFCGDLLAFYTNAVEGKEVATLIETNPGLLKTRQQRQLAYGGISLASRPNWYAWGYAFRFLGIGCQKLLARHKFEGHQRRSRFGILTRSLDVEEHKLLRDAAIRHGVTVNDIMLAELFMAFCEWNQRVGRLSRRKFKILMPSNLRRRGDDEMPAANMTTYNFIARRPKECRDRVALVKSIRQDTNEIKNGATGVRFLEAAAKGFVYKSLIPMLLSKGSTLSTSVISNVGDPTRRYTSRIPRKGGDLLCGDLVLERIAGSPPLRPNTRLSLAISTYRRKFSVSIRSDPYLYDEADNNEIMDILMDGLRWWLKTD